MRVSEVGEFGLIAILAREIGVEYPPTPSTRPRPGLLVDLGDDAVVGRRQDGAPVFTTDTLVAGVHFLAGRTPWQEVGWKALAVNVSDIAAMGAAPDIALVTLTLPDDFCVEDCVEIYRGLRDAAGTFGVTLGGGDIVRSPAFSITVALSGWAVASALGEPIVMTRHSARVGDIVAVTGFLGDSAGGLQLLLQAEKVEGASARRLVEAHQRPRARVAEGQAAVKAGVRCAIDISDGLVQDLGHVARASNAGIRIEVARLPISDALGEVFPARAAGLALSGGEDYELALVGSPAVIEALISRDPSLTEIGEVVSLDGPRVAVVDEAGREVPLPAGGWDHFAATDPSR